MKKISIIILLTSALTCIAENKIQPRLVNNELKQIENRKILKA